MNMFPDFIIIGIAVFLTMISSYYITIFVHELGHLFFGILSNYKFLYFRIGAIALVKTEHKYCFRTQKVVGSAGQCLLYATRESKHPRYLFLGGIIFNGIFGFGCIISGMMASNIRGMLFFLFLGIIHLLSALLNGIPFQTTDGMSLQEVKTKWEVYYYHIQLEIARQLINGVSYATMPEKLFDLKRDKKNYSLVEFEIFFYSYYRLLEQREKNAAMERIRYLHDNLAKLNHWLKIEVRKEWLFINDRNSFTEKENKGKAKIMTPHDIRLYRNLINKKEDSKIWKHFEYYIYQGEVESEKRIMNQ